MKWAILLKLSTTVRMTVLPQDRVRARDEVQGDVTMDRVEPKESKEGWLEAGRIICVVCPYQKSELAALHPMPPILQHHLDDQQSSVADVRMSLSWCQPLRETCSVGMLKVI